MAGDWIAWVKGLTKRREVVVISEALNLPRREVACCCMEWWEWCDAEGDFDPSRDCHVTGVTFVTGLSLIDEHVGVTGFGQAMADVGWAVANKDGDLMHPKLGSWTGSAAKERLRANARQAKHRGNQRKKSRSNCDKSVTREEKRREGSCTTYKNIYDAHFEQFWQTVPPRKRGGKQDAARAYRVAAALLKGRGPDPHEFLCERAQAYYASPLGQTQFCSGAAPFLRQGHYDDDPQAWERQDDQTRRPADGRIR